jgi:hypothetical protein
VIFVNFQYADALPSVQRALPIDGSQPDVGQHVDDFIASTREFVYGEATVKATVRR